MLGRTSTVAALGPVLGLGLALALASGCRAPEQTAVPQPPAPAPAEPPAPKRIDRQLETIAGEIDPGEVKPMIADLPEWLAPAFKGQLDDSEAPADTLARAREDLTAWEEAQADGDVGVESLARFARAIYLAEHLLVSGEGGDGDLLAHLERLYAMLDQPFFTSERGFFRQSLGLIVDAAAREGILAEQRQVSELVAFMDGALRRAGALKRRAAAELLREHPDRVEIPDVLRHLADDAARDQRFARAVELSAIALRRDPDEGAAELLLHADRCYIALDLEAGDAARDKAVAAAAPEGEPRRVDFDKKAANVATTRAYAAEALALADAPTIDEQLRRGHLLVLLGRFDDATAVYTALKEAYPKDARPYAGLTKVALNRDMSFFGELPIHQARGLENRDREFYEVSLGLATGRLLGEVMPAAVSGGDKVDAILGGFLGEFREDAEGWAQYEPGRAAVLIALADALQATLPLGLKGEVKKLQPKLRKLVRDFAKVRKAHPEVREAWEATYVASLFAKSRKEAWKAAMEPLPEALAGDLDLQRERLKTLRNVVLLWEQGDPVADLEAALASAPKALADDDVVLETSALIDFLKMRGGDAEAGGRAIGAYQVLAQRRSGAAKAQALNNLGVLRSLSGDLAGAITTWEEGIKLADETGRDMIYLNAAVQGLGPGSAQSLETLAASQHSALIRLQALAWRAELVSRSGGDDGAAVDALREGIERERGREMRANLPLGGFGVLSTGDFTANLGYSVADGLALTLAVNATPWLVPPAPLTIPGNLKKAGKKRRGAKATGAKGTAGGAKAAKKADKGAAAAAE
jgi:tetratricopeptide (TPR) repeat protein